MFIDLITPNLHHNKTQKSSFLNLLAFRANELMGREISELTWHILAVRPPEFLSLPARKAKVDLLDQPVKQERIKL